MLSNIAFTVAVVCGGVAALLRIFARALPPRITDEPRDSIPVTIALMLAVVAGMVLASMWWTSGA